MLRVLLHAWQGCTQVLFVSLRFAMCCAKASAPLQAAPTTPATALSLTLQVVLDCGQDALKNAVTGRESSFRNMHVVAGVRDLVKSYNETTCAPASACFARQHFGMVQASLLARIV